VRVPAAYINPNLPSGWALPRGWQAYAIFGLLPVWWLNGLSAVVWVVIAVPLLAALAIRGELRAPRRFGIWLLLLLWVGASGLELTSGSRTVAWAWRGSFYLAGTVLWLSLGIGIVYATIRFSMRATTAGPGRWCSRSPWSGRCSS
jgi:hypothetical protein